jgi:hypothetical protein
VQFLLALSCFFSLAAAAQNVAPPAGAWRNNIGINTIAYHGVLKKLLQTIGGAGFRSWQHHSVEFSTTRASLFFSQTKKAKDHGA